MSMINLLKPFHFDFESSCNDDDLDFIIPCHNAFNKEVVVKFPFEITFF